MNRLLYITALLFTVTLGLLAQAPHPEGHKKGNDELIVIQQGESVELLPDSVWKPYPRKATLLSAALPGAGQIYNRQWWKVSVIYAGLGTLGYFVHWNHTRYTEYHNAYLDIADDDPTTNRYYDVLPPDYVIDDEDWLETVLENGKDKYRRDRDLLIFSMVGVYVLNILEANVAAHLYDFDVSEDLSLNLSPLLNYDLYKGAPQVGFTITLSINQ